MTIQEQIKFQIDCEVKRNASEIEKAMETMKEPNSSFFFMAAEVIKQCGMRNRICQNWKTKMEEEGIEKFAEIIEKNRKYFSKISNLRTEGSKFAAAEMRVQIEFFNWVVEQIENYQYIMSQEA